MTFFTMYRDVGKSTKLSNQIILHLHSTLFIYF